MRRTIVAAVACFVACVAPRTSSAQVSVFNHPQLSLASSNATTEHCYVVGVAAFADRVHIQCGSTIVGTQPLPFLYFAVENNVSQNALALTMLAVANEAIEHNRPLTIIYRTGAHENPAGCDPSDCRRLVGAGIRFG